MTLVATSVDAVGLGSQRRALRDELERVQRWRRVVRARLDIAVAVAVPPGLLAMLPGLAEGTDLGMDVPDPAELDPLLCDRVPAVEVRALAELRGLDVRLAAYERAVGCALRAATDRYVERLAEHPDERARVADRLAEHA